MNDTFAFLVAFIFCLICIVLYAFDCQETAFFILVGVTARFIYNDLKDEEDY